MSGNSTIFLLWSPDFVCFTFIKAWQRGKDWDVSFAVRGHSITEPSKRTRVPLALRSYPRVCSPFRICTACISATPVNACELIFFLLFLLPQKTIKVTRQDVQLLTEWSGGWGSDYCETETSPGHTVSSRPSQGAEWGCVWIYRQMNSKMFEINFRETSVI